jgi:hypothetical protein
MGSRQGLCAKPRLKIQTINIRDSIGSESLQPKAVSIWSGGRNRHAPPIPLSGDLNRASVKAPTSLRTVANPHGGDFVGAPRTFGFNLTRRLRWPRVGGW